ncbi:MAG TPA: HNH endonuclease [Chthoniobacterales bacterium]|nr:HNH endonuclease [Chthoniobacterales bacterium]
MCCYCESQVGPVRADEIEHRMPINGGFPGSAFDWDNLHLACSGCNGEKSNQWDAAHPILDAVTDVPIEDHLGYECSDSGVRQLWLTPRGHTTESHAKLNRDKLRGARDTIMIKVVGLIQEIRNRLENDPADVLAANRRQGLEEMYTGPYGSMIRWAATTLL